uniref:Uncharacterized protein n=1 Tax=Moniliophthora roreri TaxID=221103 RepID=A0A0W0FQX8_MONRR
MTIAFSGSYAIIMDSVDANLPPDAYLAKSPVLCSLISDILDHSSRIRHLSLVFAGKPYASPSPFASSLRNCFPNLTHLTLMIQDDDPRRALETFSESPLLYSVDLLHPTIFSSTGKYSYPILSYYQPPYWRSASGRDSDDVFNFPQYSISRDIAYR